MKLKLTGRYYIAGFLALGLTAGIIWSCGRKTDKNGKPLVAETMTSGTITILVDESVQPAVDDVLDVFHHVYEKAHINAVASTENEIINALLSDSIKTVVLARPLTEKEEAHFTNKSITPEVTFIATDALAVFTAGKPSDTTITTEEIFKVLRGQPSDKIKTLVLDNPNSGTVQYLLAQAGVQKLPKGNIAYRKNSSEVIKFVNDNPGSIGIVGLNWLLQPTPQLEKVVENLTTLGVDNVKTDKGAKKFYKPSQSTISQGLYPFTRKIYVLNYQGFSGLGIGFANYVRAEQGQRIILKSGLLPMEIPSREIQLTN